MAASVPAWWMGLYTSERFRSMFVQPEQWPLLRSFPSAEALLTMLTFAAATQHDGHRTSAWTGPAAVGAWAYATAWSVQAAASDVILPSGAIGMCLALAVVIWSTDAIVPASRHHKR